MLFLTYAVVIIFIIHYFCVNIAFGRYTSSHIKLCIFKRDRCDYYFDANFLVNFRLCKKSCEYIICRKFNEL